MRKLHARIGSLLRPIFLSESLWPMCADLIAKTIVFVCAAFFLTASARLVPAHEMLAAARLVSVQSMSAPGYLQTVTDRAFGTVYTRVTDPGRQMLPGAYCRPAYCTHRYSSAQPWNADQSLLAIVNGCAASCLLFLDGKSYKPLFKRSVHDECEWHPTNPALMICVSANLIYTWMPRTDSRIAVITFRGYESLQFGPYKGNPSRDGRRLVVRARNRAGAVVAFAYDLATSIKYPDIELSKLDGTNDYCGISPSGRYIFCSQVMQDETNQEYVFTAHGEQLQHWSENHRPGHGDMTIDDDGDDVYVGISKSDPDKYCIIKRRLRDGVVTVLAPYGEGQHASMRSIGLPDWVFVTYTGSYSEVSMHREWAPFYAEIVALRIDGSGEIRRIVQTRDVKSDYWSEAHASPSPDGSQVIWSSNWGRAGGPVADYVVRLHWP
jgi:hypothetical protein